ncbi:MAG: TlpA disulfide reductase family protein [Phenylobacterium sp.]
MKSWTLCALVLAALLAASPVHGAGLGKPARPYKIITFDHQTVPSTDLRGKVVVLNYWATWCTPCRAEMIVFDNYMRRHKGTDLAIFAVATEDSIPASKLKPLASVLSFPLAARLTGGGYGVMSGVPTSYVIDRAGVIRHAEAGAFDAESFDALVTPLLAEAPPVTVAAAGAQR